MSVSVIIPAYNAAKYLPETIESVRRQTLSAWQLIVVDDGSTDSTVQAARQYADKDPRIRVVTQSNAGVSAARNTGFAAAGTDSEFVCYLDADDTWEPDTLETLTQALATQPNAAAAYGLPRAIDENGQAIRVGELEAHFRERWAVEGTRLVRWPSERPTTFACEVVTNCVQTSGTLVLRRGLQEKAGGFDERMGGCADWDMWLRLCRYGDLAFVNRVALNYRQHGGNMSAKSTLMAHDEAFLRSKLLSWSGETPERRQQAIWGYRHRSRQIFRLRMQWTRDSLRAGKPVQAVKNLRHAAQMYRIYAFGPPSGS